MTIDTETQQSLDEILADEIRRGFRAKDLPLDLAAQLKLYGFPRWARVRFTRVNPQRRRKINEAVQRAYHRDLKNPEILSNEQVMQLVRERGEWGPEKDRRMEELRRETNKAMAELYVEGFVESTAEWATEIVQHAARWKELLEASPLPAERQAELLAIFDRWVQYSPDQRDAYTERFSTPGPDGAVRPYSPHRDATTLADALHQSLEATDLINEIEDLLDKVHRFVALQEQRAELAKLSMQRAEIFADTVEGRRENALEMARLYFTCEVVEPTGVVEEGEEVCRIVGPLTPTFDALWDLPDDVIQWLLVESYFFHNGIPDETRPYLETFGFIRGERKSPTTESGPSDESPVPPTSRPDSEASTATA